MTRRRPPPRRPALRRDLVWARGPAQHHFAVSFGFDLATGRVNEVFADLPGGSDMAAVVADACIVISLALQHGAASEDLDHSLQRVESPASGAILPASPLGTIVHAIRRVEAEHAV